MAEPQQVLYRNVATGQLGYVDADKAKAFDSDPDYRRADNAELTRARERAQADTLSGQVETFGRGVAQGVGSVAQTVEKLRTTPLGQLAETAINPVGAFVGGQIRGGLESQGIATTDLSRSLPSQVAGAVGGDEQAYAERDRLLAEVNPGTMTAGQLVGETAVTLPTGGAAGAFSASRGLAAKVASQIIQGGAEGALLGASGTVRDAQRLGTGATDEELLAGGLMGAALGGGISGGLTGLGGAARAVKTKMGSSLSDLMASRTATAESGLAGEIAADGTETLLGRVKRAISTDPQGVPTGNVARSIEEAQVAAGAPREAIREFGALNRSEEARAARDLVRDQAKIHEHAVGSITRSIGDVEDAIEDVIRPIWTDPAKAASQNARKLAPELYDGAKAAAIDTARAIEADLTQQVADLSKRFGKDGKQSIDVLASVLGDVRAALKTRADAGGLMGGGALEARSAPEWLVRIENLKRSAGRGKMSINTNLKSDRARMAAEEVRSLLDNVYDGRLRPFLENEEILGDVARGQKAINVPYKALLDDNGAYRSQVLSRGFNKEWDTGRVSNFVDPAKIDTMLKRVGRFENDPLIEMVSGRIEGAGALLKAAKETLELTPGEMAKIDAAIAANAQLKTEMGDTLSRVGKINKFSALEEVEKRNAASMGILPGMGGIGGGAMVGGLVGGPMGALLGAGLATTASMIARPASFALASDHIADVAARAIGTKWLSAAKSLVEGPVSAGAGKVSRAASRVASGASGVTTVARKAATPIALEMFRGGEKDLQKAYEKRADTIIAAVQQSPVDAMDQLRKSAPALDDAPELAAAVLDRQQRAIGFLAANMPGSLWVKNPLNPTARPRPANEEIINYAKGWEAVVNPSTVIRDLARGVAVPIQMEALRTVYPGMLEALQRKTWQEVQKMDAAGKPIPLYRRQRLDMLLDLNGAGIPALSQQFADKVIAMRTAAESQQAKPQQSKPPQLSAAMASTQTNWPSARGA